MKRKDLMNKVDEEAVIRAISAAERACAGEIRVHIEGSAGKRDIRKLAERTFERIGMTRTAARNGVLIFICAEQQSFVVLGDRGIHEHVGDDFWSAVAGHLEEHFRSGEFTEGLVAAITEVGAQLERFFPWEETDVNELPDAISRSDES